MNKLFDNNNVRMARGRNRLKIRKAEPGKLKEKNTEKIRRDRLYLSLEVR